MAKPEVALDGDERAALVTLLRRRPEHKSWLELTRHVCESGSALETLEFLSPSGLFPAAGEPTLSEAADDIHAWEESGLRFITILDNDYPESLREVYQAPPFLFAKGDLEPADVAVSVVGSRTASKESLDTTYEVAARLVRLGITVASGLATGVDTVAHRTALDEGGRTVAIIGTGLRRSYPPSNRALQDEISHRGLVLSQFWPTSPPHKYTFLMRNATMSGYGIASIVIEAGEHSGARSQARMAIEHGRPVILARKIVESTHWGATISSRPGVFVASTVHEIIQAVLDVRRTPDAVEKALKSLIYS